MKVRDESITTVELHAGHTYALHADRIAGSGRTFFWIEDNSSGRLIAGQKNPSLMTEDEQWAEFAWNEQQATFFRAARTGDVASLGRLIAGGLEVDCRDRVNRTALIYAAWHDQVVAIDYLLEQGADINAQLNPPWGSTAPPKGKRP